MYNIYRFQVAVTLPTLVLGWQAQNSTIPRTTKRMASAWQGIRVDQTTQMRLQPIHGDGVEPVAQLDDEIL
jgi:hypothetical protein